MQIQIKRGTEPALSGVNPIFDSGELVLSTDSLKLKAGDGILPWNSLSYISGASHASSHSSDGNDPLILTTNQISNFNNSVSGLLPVTNIVGGTNISVIPSGSVFTVGVSGSLGLTTEEVDDRVSNLLVAGSGINLNYDDNANTLTLSTSGLQSLLTNPVTGVGTSGYLSRWNGSNNLTSGIIFDNGTNVGIGTTSPSGLLDVAGNLTFNTFTEKVITNTNSGSGVVLSIDSGTVHKITLTNNCSFTVPSAVAGKSFSIFLNTGSGNYTASFSGVLWSDSAPPVITTIANKIDILSFISDGSYWYGSYSQNYGYASETSTPTPTATPTPTPTSTPTPTNNSNQPSLLLHFDGASFIDSSPNSLGITYNGNASISSSESKFGGSSGYFNGGYITIGDSFGQNLALNLTYEIPFTIECWIYMTANTGTYSTIATRRTGINWQWQIGFSNPPLRKIYFSTSGTGGGTFDISDPTEINLNQWYHYAIVRNNAGLVSMYRDGTSVAATSFGAVPNNNAPLYIGAKDNGGEPFPGYVDEFRIVKGVAVYTGNFTPPTAPFSNSGI